VYTSQVVSLLLRSKLEFLSPNSSGCHAPTELFSLSTFAPTAPKQSAAMLPRVVGQSVGYRLWSDTGKIKYAGVLTAFRVSDISG